MTLIDIEDGKKKATRRYILNIIFVIFVSLIAIAGIVLFLILSPHRYMLFAVIDIIIAALTICFLIFYFVNVFPLIRYYYTFYKGMNNVSLERPRYLTFVKEKERKDIGKVSHRTLEFSYSEGNKTYKENIYILDNDEITFKEDDVYKITTYHNVLVRYEESNHAND